MNQPFSATHEKPTLDEAGFQQLLAAAFVLQSYNERTRQQQDLESKPQEEVRTRKPVRPSLRQRTDLLSEIVDIQNAIQTQELSVSECAQLIADRVLKITKASGAAVGLLSGDDVVWAATAGSASEEAGLQVPGEMSLSLHCLLEGKLLECTDTEQDSQVSPELCRQHGVRSLISVPIVRDGDLAGVLEVRFDQANGFREQDVRACQLLAGLVTEALKREAEHAWKKALAAERETMLEALERLKPQLERLATEQPRPSHLVSQAKPIAEPSANAEPLDGKSVAAPVPSHIPETDLADNRDDPGEPYDFRQTTAPVGADDFALPQSSPASDVEEEIPAEQTYYSAEPAVEVRPVECAGCGRLFEDGESFCGICGTPHPEKKPSGDIQSKWASMWHMQQARTRLGSVGAGSTEAAVKESASSLEPGSDGAIVQESESEALTVADTDPESLESQDPERWQSAQSARQWLETQQAKPSWRTRLARLWRFHRANIYLAIAGTLLALVLAGWGDGASSVSASNGRAGRHSGVAVPKLTLFEKTLVAMGLAVPPPSATPTYKGNPDTRVWLDVHTALYYCPGADLYGKTPGGKYASQGDAQVDQYEPASRQACD